MQVALLRIAQGRYADAGKTVAEAKALLASAYDQLGYRAESGPWRDVYLTGAYELRNGGQGMAVVAGVMGGVDEEEDLPNVIITPHTSGAMQDYWTPLVALFSDNLRRFERGEPLVNVVDKVAGY